MFARDKELARRISVYEQRICLGELLERISAQTGVSLSASDTPSPSSGIEVGVALNGVELRELMTGLAGVLTHPHSAFTWTKVPADKPGYRLIHTRSLTDAALATRREILSQWGKDLRAFRELALTAEPQRTERAAAFPHLIFSPQRYDWRKAELLAKSTPADLDAILAIAAQRGGLSTATTPPGPMPGGLDVHWNSESLCPVLIAGGSNLVGSSLWDHMWLKKTLPQWMVPRDPEPLAWVARKRNGQFPGNDGPGGTMGEWVERAGKDQGLNFIQDQVRNWEARGDTWFGNRPEHTVLGMVGRESHLHQLGGVNLLRHQSALTHRREYLVSWSQTRALQELARKTDFLPPGQLVALAKLNAAQRDWLNDRVPGSDSPYIEAWKPIFEFYEGLPDAARRQLATPEGVRFGELDGALRRPLLVDEDPKKQVGLSLLRERGAAARISLQFEPTDLPATPVRPQQKWRKMTWKVFVPNGPMSTAHYTQRGCGPLGHR